MNQRNIESLETVIMTITPAIAAEFLERNINNRNLSPVKVKELASQIKDGKWMLNGDSIRFDWYGNLIDGQHRLQAVVLSQMDIRTTVTKGLNPLSFKTIDKGKKRSGGDIVGIITKLPAYQSMAISRVSNMDYHYNKRKYCSLSVNNVDVEQFVKNNPKIVDICQHMFKINPGKGKRWIIQPGICIFFYWKMQEIDPPLNEIFWEKIIKGVGISEGEPIFHVRNIIQKWSCSRLRVVSFHEMAYVIARAWNCYRKGSFIKNERNYIYQIGKDSEFLPLQ